MELEKDKFIFGLCVAACDGEASERKRDRGREEERRGVEGKRGEREQCLETRASSGLQRRYRIFVTICKRELERGKCKSYSLCVKKKKATRIGREDL